MTIDSVIMYDEFDREALAFLNTNANLLKTTSWEFRGSAIRNCHGYCPISFLAFKKGKSFSKENWQEAAQELNLSQFAGFEIARAADYNDLGNEIFRNKLIEILNPIRNPKYKFEVYNE